MSESTYSTVPLKPFRTFGGAKIPHYKNTQDVDTKVMPAPETVEISMSQHIGAPCKPLVKAGDFVKVGQKIAESDKFVSAPIHASVSGKVEKIGSILLSSGQRTQSIIIKSDGKMETDESIKPPKINNAKDFFDAVRESGLVGLGGAGFPSHVKLNVPEGKNAEILIINGAECEPFITSDYREMVESPDDILEGVYEIKKILGIKKVLICIEGNKPKAIDILSKIAYDQKRDPDNEVRVVKLKSNYPQGAEKVLIQAAANRLVPAGGLPIDVGCIVMNIASVAFLSRFLKTGMPLISKRLTIDGSAIKNPSNVIAPIGTKIRDIIEFCGGYKMTPRKILMGGPMMGIAIFDDELPILKQNNAILAFDKEKHQSSEISPCIRCGRCVRGCPMKLMPTVLEQCASAKDKDAMLKNSINTCMECGTCSFVCPANRQLIQAIRTGKQVLREGK